MRYVIILFLSMIHGVCLAQAPTEIGGFRLGADESNYAQLVKPQTKLPIRFMEFLEEVEIKRTAHFKSGYLAYGTCDAPGKIVRIKLKYADSSKEFFETLLAKYKKQYGRPTQWLGDSFHITLGWKWSFQEGRDRIDLFLQHNTRNTEKKLGNTMKLTINNSIDAERLCFDSKFPEFRTPVEVTDNGKSRDWEILIPK